MNQRLMTRLFVFGLLGLAAGIVVLYATFSTVPLGEKHRPIDELGGPFTLQTKQGPFSLSDIEGKVGVLYFGFLNCTEACPASIAVFRSALAQLSDEEKQDVQFVFISVDPARDSLDDLDAFSGYYGGDMVAVTGSEQEIDNLTRDYGVFFDLVDLEGSALEYTVDHSSRFYMVDQTGDLLTTMSHSTTPTELAARIQQIIKGEYTPPI
ncbi:MULTISPECIES: SCO family protein [unclassified Vibrio]|uniref:SCO family protein n=1 Tax=Vibrio sp. HB236076 TaxID=3232307 RepID=A0AB39HBM4_9VIBR|nr:SCO family protein [Vibrio sp. HB161653]MDP5255525.1 SCO family protein [Vibrio sp. HB161653]